MSDCAEPDRPAIIVPDASVLINFLRIDRIDLFAGHSHVFLATDHVASEISDRYPDQQRRFASALESGALTLIPVAAAEELRLFAALSAAVTPGRGGVFRDRRRSQAWIFAGH